MVMMMAGIIGWGQQRSEELEVDVYAILGGNDNGAVYIAMEAMCFLVL